MIFGPRRAFGCDLCNLTFAQLLAQRGHEFVVAPLLGGFTLLSEFVVLRIDVPAESRSYEAALRLERKDRALIICTALRSCAV
jgi:hypothetical protein